jgi:GAF domain-containing protein
MPRSDLTPREDRPDDLAVTPRPRPNSTVRLRTAAAELATTVLTERPVGAVLHRIVSLAAVTIPGADEVSISMVHDGRLRAVAFSGPLGAALDERQHHTGFGPCLDAARTGRTIVIEDTAHSPRYPGFAALAHRNGIHHTLTLSLPAHHGTAGALNLYGHHPGPFSAETRSTATAFIELVTAAAINATTYAVALDEIAQLQTALVSRAGIEQAKGILMRDLSCSPEHAFAVLSDRASRSNRKLRDLAEDVVAASQA